MAEETYALGYGNLVSLRRPALFRVRKTDTTLADAAPHAVFRKGHVRELLRV